MIFLLGLASPALFFATIVRYRIFDLYVVVRRGSLYSILTAAVTVTSVVLFFVLLYLLPVQELNFPVIHITGEHIEIIRLKTLSQEQRMIFEKRLFLSFGVLIIALLWWLHRRGRRVLDARFYRGSYDYKHALRITSYNVCYTKLLRRMMTRSDACVVMIPMRMPMRCAARVITSYSIHYTKLYEGHTASFRRFRSG